MYILTKGHNMTVIATDGSDVRPQVVNSLVLHNAERYDVVVDTRDKDARTYKIMFGGLMDCSANGIHGTALLTYTQV